MISYLLIFILLIAATSYFNVPWFITVICLASYVIIVILKYKSDYALQKIAIQTGKEMNNGIKPKTKRTRDLEKISEKKVQFAVLTAFTVLLILIGKFSSGDGALIYILTFISVAIFSKKVMEKLQDDRGLISIDFTVEPRKISAWKLSYRAYNKLALEDSAGNSSYLHEPFKGTKKGEWYLVDSVQMENAKVIVNRMHTNSEVFRNELIAFSDMRLDWAKTRNDNAKILSLMDRLTLVAAVKLLNRLEPIRKSFHNLIRRDVISHKNMSAEEEKILDELYPKLENEVEKNVEKTTT